jgi:tetrahydromethanopterin S-methyltransferase subunit G
MTTAELQTQISAMRENIKAQQERLDELEKQLENADELDAERAKEA